MQPEAPLPESDQIEDQRAAEFLAASRLQFDLPAFEKRSPLARNAIFVAVVTLLVLGLVGGFAESFVSDGSISKNFAATPTTATSLPVLATGRSASARSLFTYMGLKKIGATAARNFTLTDQHNRVWSLKANRGKVVVITFYNENCQDICPVLGTEIKQANSILGAEASHVTFAIVNTDPEETASLADPPALSIPSLETVKSVYFLNGPLTSLNRVWSSYGVTVGVRSRLNISHNNVMFFITRQGRLAELAIPFGNESRKGRFRLGGSDIHRFAQGIALMVGTLIK
ncbi:MAG: SCO family protein [Acidimicrobiales bacterium]